MAMPRKKPKTSAKVTPKEALFKRLDQAVKDHNCQGSFLVVGIECDEEPEELTAEQAASLRYILINKSRDTAYNAARDFA